MKKKLEGELISIAHRVLKLKNKSELNQLLQETQKLYQALAVLKFVEDNYSEVKPDTEEAATLASLEGMYSEGEEAKPKAEASEKEKVEIPDNKVEEKNNTEAVEDNADENDDEPVAETQQSEEEQLEEEVVAEKEETNSRPETETNENEETIEPVTADDNVSEEAESEEPEVKIQFSKPEEDIKAEEASAKAVYKKGEESTPEQKEQAVDAEIKTIEPDKKAATEEEIYNFEFAFERRPAPEEPKEEQQPKVEQEPAKPAQSQMTFEDFHNYKEPEFIKKGEEAIEAKQQQAEDDDWRNWEPSKSPYGHSAKTAEPAPEPIKQPEKVSEEPKAIRSLNDALGKSISLGLNDRIAFEKHLFGGSSEDLNRVISQLNTMNRFSEARQFINDLVKPDYNNWAGKEEYEERFLGLVEKKFD